MWIPSYQTPPKYDFYLIHKCTRHIEIRTHVKCTIHKLFPNIKTLSSHVSLSFFPLSSLLSPLCLSSLSKIQCIYPIHKIHFQHERINTILLVKRGVYHLLRSWCEIPNIWYEIEKCIYSIHEIYIIRVKKHRRKKLMLY